MNEKTITIAGLILLALSHILLSFGYEFLMSQRPIDFAHWAMLFGAVFLFSLWFSLPNNSTKKVGLSLMTLGIAAVSGMCVIDFLLWSMADDLESRKNLFKYITSNPSIQLPFLALGPSLFYGGICIATYGLFSKFKWQVVTLNLGALMIGLGHMIFQDGRFAAVGGVLLLVGMGNIIFNQKGNSVN